MPRHHPDAVRALVPGQRVWIGQTIGGVRALIPATIQDHAYYVVDDDGETAFVANGPDLFDDEKQARDWIVDKHRYIRRSEAYGRRTP